MTTKRDTELPPNIKAHGPRVARLGCAYVHSLQHNSTSSIRAETITTVTTTTAILMLTRPFVLRELLSLAVLSYLDLTAAWWDRCMGTVASIYDGKLRLRS